MADMAALEQAVVEVDLCSLPAADRDQVYLLVVDSFLCGRLARAHGPSSEAFRSYVMRSAAGGGCSLIGEVHRTTPEVSAFHNGGLVHALNIDALGSAGSHVAIGSVMAPLAVAEQAGASVADYLSGVAAGVLVSEHLASIVSLTRPNGASGWLNGAVQGVFSATAAAARVLQFTPDQLRSAMGVALLQASGTKELMHSSAKAYYAAFANRAAVTAVGLAQAGMDGGCEWLEGRHGLLTQFYPGGSIEELHAYPLPIQPTETRLKSIPLSAHAVPYFEAAKLLRIESAVLPSLIGEIRILAPERLAPWLSMELPFRPSLVEATDSVPFAVACGLAFGRLDVGCLPGGDLDDLVAELGQRVVVDTCGATEDAQLVVTAADGRSFAQQVSRTLHPDHLGPLTAEALGAKMDALLPEGAAGRDQVQAVVGAVLDVPLEAPVGALVDALVDPAAPSKSG